jgi:hypothetical protein
MAPHSRSRPNEVARRRRIQLLLLAAGLIISANGVRAGVISYTVDPNLPASATNYQTISAATGTATSGNSYVITVTPGTYTNDFPEITQPTTIPDRDTE